jgi:hypothetical protein
MPLCRVVPVGWARGRPSAGGRQGPPAPFGFASRVGPLPAASVALGRWDRAPRGMNNPTKAATLTFASRDDRQSYIRALNDQLRRGFATDPGGLRAGHGRTGGGATQTSFAARAGVEAVNALTFQPDHSVGADHDRSPERQETLCLNHKSKPIY